MDTQSTRTESNDDREVLSGQLKKLQATLQTTHADLLLALEQRNALRDALADQFSQNQWLLQERSEAQARGRELADICVGQQSLIARLFSQLGSCIASLRQAEHLAGIGMPGAAPRIIRIPGITVRSAS